MHGAKKEDWVLLTNKTSPRVRVGCTEMVHTCASNPIESACREFKHMQARSTQEQSQDTDLPAITRSQPRTFGSHAFATYDKEHKSEEGISCGILSPDIGDNTSEYRPTTLRKISCRPPETPRLDCKPHQDFMFIGSSKGMTTHSSEERSALRSCSGKSENSAISSPRA